MGERRKNEMIKLTLKDPAKETPEVREWIDNVERIMSNEMDRMYQDLVCLGCAVMPKGEKQWTN